MGRPWTLTSQQPTTEMRHRGRIGRDRWTSYLALQDSLSVWATSGAFRISATRTAVVSDEKHDTHDTRHTRSMNRRHKSTPSSGAGFRRRFFVPYSPGMKISGAENKPG